MSDPTQSRALCAVDDIDDPGTRGFEVALDGQQVLRLFVVRKSGTLAAYRNNCPHTGAPLEWLLHQFFDLEQSFIQCAIHGALFRPRTATVCEDPAWADHWNPRTGGQGRPALSGCCTGGALTGLMGASSLPLVQQTADRQSAMATGNLAAACPAPILSCTVSRRSEVRRHLVSQYPPDRLPAHC